MNTSVGDFWEQQSRGAVRFGVVAGYDWTTTTATCAQPMELWRAAAARAGWTEGAGKHLLVYVPFGSTIVAVATDAFVTQLGASTNQVIWVTSAYLLAYVVPLLFTGRLGDQIGPRAVSIAGLVLFTGASLWCGLAGSIETLIVVDESGEVPVVCSSPRTDWPLRTGKGRSTLARAVLVLPFLRATARLALPASENRTRAV